MIRIKLFALFIAFALLALVRPRKCMELLEAADRGVLRNEKEGAPLESSGFYLHADGDYRNDDGTPFAHPFSAAGVTEMCTHPRCALPPPGWRCTRAAGHDGPCAAAEVVS